MAESLRGLAERLFDAVEAKDLDGVLALFTEDGLLFDPHYPTPQMIGKSAITAGLQWGFGTMKTFGFTIENFYFGDDGQSAAAEVASAHVLKAGMRLNFPQAFFFEVRDGKFTRVQAYEPYGPNGIGGVVLGLTRLTRRLTGKR
ncbi:MAG TPA: nuclear transport factor 2 family protein [Thermomicrobiales bacterium]|jgi:ketosteroid isomerase-like protein